jgi:hypothetical protein
MTTRIGNWRGNPEMFVWSGILFLLGIAAFLDSLFNYGEIFRQVNSVLFLLVSLALLVRTSVKIKQRTMEHYQQQIYKLEDQVARLTKENEKAFLD